MTTQKPDSFDEATKKPEAIKPLEPITSEKAQQILEERRRRIAKRHERALD